MTRPHAGDPCPRCGVPLYGLATRCYSGPYGNGCGWTLAEWEANESGGRADVNADKTGIVQKPARAPEPPSVAPRYLMHSLPLDIDPCPKPRQTQRDKWAKRPAVVRYRKFCDDLRELVGDDLDLVPDGGLTVEFYVPMPKSWSKKKRKAMNAKPHRQRPDVDNYAKAVLDALWPEDDSDVWDIRCVKRWSERGKIVISWPTVQHEEAA